MSIKILLDNYSNNECFSGQTLSGRVECTFNNKKSFKAISIKFYGRAKTKWHESKSYYNPATKKTMRRSIPYYAKETYITTEFNLLEANAGNPTLSAGQHFYPFSINLPIQLPGSFEGRYGNIRYYIEAIVERPWKFNYKAKMPLNVVLPMDLNFMPTLRVPRTLTKDKSTVSCWCQKMGVLTFNISVPVTGYVPGQEIEIMSYIQNMTKLTVKSVKLKVIANYEYTSYHPKASHKEDSTVIAKCVEGSVGAHAEKSWTSTLLLPADHIYANISTSNIISVSYTLKAKAVLPYPNNNLELEFPITIGSIALSEVNAVGPALPEYAAPYNYNIPYTEMYNNDTLPPPYSSVSGERGNIASAPIDEPSPHSLTMPSNFMHSYSSAEKLGWSTAYPSSAGGSAQFSSPPIEENPREITASAPPSYEESRL